MIRYGKYHMDETLSRKASTVWTLSIGGQTGVKHFSSPRVNFLLEFIPAFLAKYEAFYSKTINRPKDECDFLSVCNTAPAIGLYSFVGDEYHAYGPNLRLMKTIPSLEMLFSVYLRGLHYVKPGSNSTKVSFGTILDMGFSLMSAYIGVGSGHSMGKGHDLERNILVNFGLSVGAPYSLLEDKFKKIFN